MQYFSTMYTLCSVVSPPIQVEQNLQQASGFQYSKNSKLGNLIILNCKSTSYSRGLGLGLGATLHQTSLKPCVKKVTVWSLTTGQCPVWSSVVNVLFYTWYGGCRTILADLPKTYFCYKKNVQNFFRKCCEKLNKCTLRTNCRECVREGSTNKVY